MAGEMMPEKKRACCATASARRDVHFIYVEGQQIGIVMWDTIFNKAAEFKDDEDVRGELLRQTKIYNYIPSCAEERYEEALYEEYKKKKDAENTRGQSI